MGLGSMAGKRMLRNESGWKYEARYLQGIFELLRFDHSSFFGGERSFRLLQDRLERSEEGI